MQYKVLLLVSLLAATTMPSMAQKYQDFSMKGSSRRIKSDTTIIYVGKSAEAPHTLACYIPPANATKGGAVMGIDGKVKYKPVPLAGEKSYFGDMNDYMNDFVRKYLQLHNSTLNVVQDRSSTPFSLIDNVLEKNNIPKQLKYLAVIESALNHNAVSNAGAIGPWQLMESTARMMGLSVSRHRDDRTDWYKSTNAAAKYLTMLYGQFNDWLLVIAAYNSGPVPVQRAIERTGSHNFWVIKPYLPRETQGHVLAFVATASIFENLSKFIGLGSIPTDFQFNKDEEPVKTVNGKAVAAVKPQFTDEELKNMSIVRISEPLHMDLMCAELGIDKALLKKWNSDYELFVYNTYPTKYYSLRIPKDKLEIFIQKKDYMTKKSRTIYNNMNM